MKAIYPLPPDPLLLPATHFMVMVILMLDKKGYGKLNFTGTFTETEVYKRLSEMGYLQLRYPADNKLGVRYEPWHIKINADV